MLMLDFLDLWSGTRFTAENHNIAVDIVLQASANVCHEQVFVLGNRVVPFRRTGLFTPRCVNAEESGPVGDPVQRSVAFLAVSAVLSNVSHLSRDTSDVILDTLKTFAKKVRLPS